QVFDGEGSVTVGEARWEVGQGDLFVVPSWSPLVLTAGSQLDLFRFSDAPVIERLRFDRAE
ncbi:MAG: cupin, partial [Pseudonocardia sp.]|nr:cupin [Pseudonocardia sp.]